MRRRQRGSPALSRRMRGVIRFILTTCSGSFARTAMARSAANKGQSAQFVNYATPVGTRRTAWREVTATKLLADRSDQLACRSVRFSVTPSRTRMFMISPCCVEAETRSKSSRPCQPSSLIRVARVSSLALCAVKRARIGGCEQRSARDLAGRGS
jgi:hypothetical protein